MNQLKLYQEIVNSPLFSDGPIVVFIWQNSEGWPVIDVSSNIKKLYGYEVDDYKTQKLIYSTQIHAEDIKQVFSEVQVASASTENSFTHKPYRYLAKDGSYYWVSDSTVIIRNEHNEITHYVGYLTNITDYVHTQNELFQKNKWYKELFEISPVGIALNKMSGEFIDLNSTLHTMCGYTKEEFVKLSYWDITPLKYEKQEALQLESLLSKGVYGPYQKEYIHKDGHHIDVLLNGVKNIDNNGDEYIWSVIQDISELNKANNTIKANELKFRGVFEQANDGILIIENGIFTSCNEKAVEILGCEMDYIIGKSPDAISPTRQLDGQLSTEKAMKYIEEVLKGNAQVFEWQHINSNNTIIDMEISLSLVEESSSNTLIALWRDISDRKIIEENLRIEKEKADAANASKSQFLANMSHEIRTPLNGMLGFVDILSKDENDVKKRKQFEYIKSSGVTLLAIINDILDLSKIENGKLQIENASFVSKDLFDAVANIYTELCLTKGIKFSYKLSALVPDVLMGDILRLKQVLFNLLSNAVKFTSKDGEIHLSVDYTLSTKILTCNVQDSGIGIESKNLSKIFNAFEQEDISTTRKFGGTGLGLSISHRLMQMMGGELKVDSILSKGSTFSFSLMIEKGEEDSLIQTDTYSDNTLKFKAHALMVEDNKTNQALLSIFLDEFGLTFDIANDGLEAVEWYEKNHYDLVFMDENMPNMNGIEATEKIRDMERSSSLKYTPIIAVTANALHGDKDRFLEAGMNEYISKPYNEDDIQIVLEKYLKQ